MSDNRLLHIVRGYLFPRPRVRFYDDFGAVYDLTSHTVTVKLADRDYGLIWEGHAGTVLAPPTAGYAEYAWTAGETSLVPGDYLMRFVAVAPGGDEKPLPNDEPLIIRVHPDFA